MPNNVVDVVNFNADASCLSSDHWLKCLEGGGVSVFCQWLQIFVDLQKPVSLGLTGVTIADLKYFNPEAIALINSHPGIFELVLRPWAHDIGIFRLDDTFRFNARAGLNTIRREFSNIANFYLPPEFMINSRQLEILITEFDIDGVFINRDRYDNQTAERIPDAPYCVKATGGTSTGCISIANDATRAYLRSIQLFDVAGWNAITANSEADTFFSWRDGESVFLIPGGAKREHFWLSNEEEHISRSALSGLELQFISLGELPETMYETYPVHSFLAWMQEMKMMWFVSRVSNIELNFVSLSLRDKALFLQMINSDILAAVEKRSPIVQLSDGQALEEFTIFRQEKGFEGEELLSLIDGGKVSEDASHIKKLRARESYLETLHAW